MSVLISSVKKGSLSDISGIREGDFLVSVNGCEIRDMLDYGFRTSEEKLEIIFERDGELHRRKIFKNPYEDLGLCFDEFLMDGQHSCKNKCIFCFIDQLPKGMRPTLYFKDDDERLSFLFGNYITLTNLEDEDVDRVIEMKISPINISVHTLDPLLRCKMMNNRFAGEKLSYMNRFADAGIEMNCQIVLCPGVNDGEHLDFTVKGLFEMYPSVRSVAIVPVGLTKYREGLPKLREFNAEEAALIVDRIEGFSESFRRRTDIGFVYLSDEWYLKAGRDLPDEEYYDGYPQIENGVGMISKFRTSLDDLLDGVKCNSSKRKTHIITGELAEGFICECVEKIKKRFNNIDATVHVVKNEFFGGGVNVAGLVTGGDIMSQLSPEKVDGDLILIPSSMLRSEGDLFLDGISLKEVEKYFGREIAVNDNAGEFLSAVTGR
ncbi:MAG: DUF512 domain-containing protein [Ruminococcaceae bacterium]|nr:DUF512 domain-containing protein [Oscillospiraceae bacterium]